MLILFLLLKYTGMPSKNSCKYFNPSTFISDIDVLSTSIQWHVTCFVLLTCCVILLFSSSSVFSSHCLFSVSISFCWRVYSFFNSVSSFVCDSWCLTSFFFSFLLFYLVLLYAVVICLVDIIYLFSVLFFCCW